MSVVVVVLPKLDDAKKIRKILMSHGFHQVFACASASSALQEVNQHSHGLVISAYHLKDMYYVELSECLPSYFELILLGSASTVGEAGAGVLSLTMPLKVYDLVNTVEMVLHQMERRIKKDKKPKKTVGTRGKLYPECKSVVDGTESPDGRRSSQIYSEMQYG